jgi:putative DNA primase/helicase
MKKISDERVGRQSHSESEIKGATPAIRAALAVAADYPVFPCEPVSKGPIEKGGHGFKDATQDPDKVRGWWRKYPGALIGVPTGAASGLLAIDCDPKSGDWYQRHRKELGTYRTHQTRRGKHLLYRYPEGSGIRNSQKSETIDVRGEGGYIVWWPAHGGVSVGEPGEPPRWLCQLCKELSEEEPPLKANGHAPPAGWSEVPDGERDDWLSARAYSLVKAGWGEQKVLDTIRALSEQHCKPPKTEKELLRIVRGKRRFINPDAAAIVRRMSEILEEDVDWLWKGFLARNKVHIIAGAGATMKSTLTLSMAATITRGGRWPDGTRCPKGNVILWTGEDDLGDTVKPRFRFAGGDQTRCTVLTGVTEEEGERPFNPGTDIELLDRECTRLGDVSLIIIDPIVVIVQKDNNDVADVRRALFPLQKLAEKHNAVILGIQHFNKGSKGKDPVERITGSGGWSQAPRIVLATAPIVDGEGKDPTKYVFACIKTFAKKQKGGFEYGFEEEPKTEIARTVWGRHLEGTGHAILTEAEGGEDGVSKLGAAKQFLRAVLAKGPLSYQQVSFKAAEANITGITLKRASIELNIEKLKVGKNASRWYLPDSEKPLE